jgi:hypothetical protein
MKDMHAVIFQVDMKQGWEGDADAELDFLVDALSSTPSFIRGTWMSDGRRGLSCLLFESEDVARDTAANASLPPTASATLRTADVYQVVRDT